MFLCNVLKIINFFLNFILLGRRWWWRDRRYDHKTNRCSYSLCTKWRWSQPSWGMSLTWSKPYFFSFTFPIYILSTSSSFFFPSSLVFVQYSSYVFVFSCDFVLEENKHLPNLLSQQLIVEIIDCVENNIWFDLFEHCICSGLLAYISAVLLLI